MPLLDTTLNLIRRLAEIATLLLLATAALPSAVHAAPGVTNTSEKKKAGATGTKAKTKGRATARVVESVRVSIARGKISLLRAGTYVKEQTANGDVLVHLQ